MAQVFISYSRKDEAFAQQLVAALAEEKRDVWLDREDIELTADWKQRVLRGIEGANTFVCILSADYASSAVCAEEAKHAIAHNKRLIPVLRRPVDFNALPPAIAAINALPLGEADNFAAGVRKLTAALDTDFEWLDQHTRLLQRALEWQASAGDKSLILRGSDLRAAEEWLARAGATGARNPTQLQTEYILASRRASNRRLRTSLGVAVGVVAVTIVLAAIATIQRGIARTERARAEQRTREVSQNLSRSDSLEATRRLAANETSPALAHLARALRVDPENAIAQRRVISLLSQRNWQFPALDPLVHSDAVVAAECTPNSKRIVTSSVTGPVQLWNLESGARIADLLVAPTLPTLLVSRDGARIAVAYDRVPGEIASGVRCHLFDGVSGQPLLELPLSPGSLAAAAFTADGKRLLLGLRLPDGSGEIRTFDVATGHPASRSLSLKNGVPAAIDAAGARAIVFEREGAASPDEKRLVARVWNLQTGKPATAPFRHDEDVEAAIFSPDGDHIATRTRSRLFVWNLPADRPVFATEPVPDDRFLSHIAYSPDAKQIVAINVVHRARQEDWTAQTFDTLTGERIGSDIQDHGLFAQAAFSPDSKFLLLCSSGPRARVWRAMTPEMAEPQEVVVPLEHSDVVTLAKMTPDGRRIITASWDKTLRVWDASVGVGAALPKKLASAAPVEFSERSPRGARIAMVSAEPMGLEIWDATTLAPVAPHIRQTHRIVCAHFSGDERRLITGSDDGIARVWDATTGQLLSELRHPTGGSVGVAQLNFDGSRAVTSTTAAEFLLWDVTTGRSTALPAGRSAETFRGAEFSPDGKLLLIALDGEITAWDTATAAPAWGPFPFAGVSNVRFSPDGKRFIALGQAGTAGLFDAASGKLEHALDHRGIVVDASFSKDGRYVATCSFVRQTAGYAQVWDAATGAAITQPLVTADEMHQVTLSPDATLVCGVERFGGARVWSIATGQESVDRLPHDVPASPAWFSNDGKRLFTVADGTVQMHELWDFGGPAPPWLPDVAEAVGGLSVNDNGVAVPLRSQVQALSAVRATIAAASNHEALVRWGRWFFADRQTRSISPSAQRTMRDNEAPQR